MQLLVLPMKEARRTEHAREWSVQTYARVAGVLFLISLVAGGFGEFYVPSKLIVSADASATAQNIQASGRLFRFGFAAYLVEAMCDIGLTWALYLLLMPVRKDIALLAAFFRLVSTATFAFAELFYFATSLILGSAGYLKTFSPDQVNSLALLSFKVYGYGGGLFMVFYGVGSILLGYLIFQSEYLPKFLGILLALGGVGFVIRNFALVLAPAYASDAFLLPAMLAMPALILWFLIRGVNVRKWEEKAANSDASV
jgi:hypothetical protein